VEGEVKPIVMQFLQERGLELSPTKTVITHVEKALISSGKTCAVTLTETFTKPSKKNVKTFLAGIRTTIKPRLAMSAPDLIEESTQGSGLGQLSSARVSKRTFSRVDTAIFSCLWRWREEDTQTKTSVGPKRNTLRPLGRNWTSLGNMR